jgi:hypothetical protein
MVTNVKEFRQIVNELKRKLVIKYGRDVAEKMWSKDDGRN